MRAQQEPVLLDLVRLAYGAAAGSSGWQAFLEAYRQALGGAVVSFMYLDRQTRASSVSEIAGPAGEEAMRGYTHYGALNPHFRHRTESFQAGQVTLGHLQYPIDKLLKTEYYNDYLRKLGMETAIGACLVQREDVYAHLSCLRPFSSGVYDAREVDFVRVLMPHLQRAVQLHTRLGGLRLDVRAEAETLDRLTMAVFVVTRESRVQLMNAAAEHLLSACDGLVLSGHQLRASHGAEDSALRNVIARASRMARGEALDAGGVLRLSRPSLGLPLSVLVVPTQPALAYPRLPRGCVTVLVRDPARPTEGDGLLRTAYGLTTTEAKLAHRLFNGETLEASATALAMSRETARTHLKAIFRKSGVHRQTDLVRAVTTSLAAHLRSA